MQNMGFGMPGGLPQVAHSAYGPAGLALAPAKEQVVFDLDAAAFSSDDFRMYNFKVRFAAGTPSCYPDATPSSEISFPRCRSNAVPALARTTGRSALLRILAKKPSAATHASTVTVALLAPSSAG